MSVSRRKILHSMALTGAAALLPRAAFPQGPSPAGGFPPQTQIDADPLRPRYHLAPRRGWMNDPCAPVYFDGRYHLFYQHNPQGSVWGNMSWAHAVSVDMVHWTDRPLALQPTPGGPDSFGVFTGSMVMDKGVPTILYTCVSPSTPEEATLWNSHPPEREAQCIAVPAPPKLTHLAKPAKGGPLDQNVNVEGPYQYFTRDGVDANLDAWIKNPTPVIAAPPPGMHVTGFRDPVPWREEDGNYYMLLASGQKGIGGNVLLYRSPDLHQWQYQGIFAQGKPTGQQTDDTVDSGETWECPDFFPLGGKHVLIHSAGTLNGRKTMWQSGTLNKKTMHWTPEKEGVLNHGPYYAPKTQLDAHGNRILWGWIPETWSDADMTKHGWSGCMSLPRVLTLVDGEVRFAPAPAVDTLRSKKQPDDANRTGLQEEIVFHVVKRTPQNGPVPSSPRLSTPMLVVETNKTPGVTTLHFGDEAINLPANLPGSFSIRCFLDHSLVEIFVGYAVVLTRRVYDGSSTVLTLPSTMEVDSIHLYSLDAI